MSIVDLSPALTPMVSKLQQWWPLEDGDAPAILALPHVVRRLGPGEYIVHEGDRPTHSCVLLSGFAYRQKVTKLGTRQILSIHMKGDIVDLQNSLLRDADHSVQALTHIEAAFIPVEAVEELAFERRTIGRAMWYETLVEASIFREWIVNVGRRDARTRTAHLLCEFGVRLAVAGLKGLEGFELPMTQEEFGDALGLTSVHVNRTLKVLENDGLIDRTQRAVRVLDWDRLASAGDFDDAYLHLRREGRVAGAEAA